MIGGNIADASGVTGGEKLLYVAAEAIEWIIQQLSKLA